MFAAAIKDVLGDLKYSDVTVNLFSKYLSRAFFFLIFNFFKFFKN